MRHIGILGSSYPATALLFQRIGEYAARTLGGINIPPVSVHAPHFARFLTNPNSWEEILTEGIKLLQSTGVDLITCPANTVQDQFCSAAQTVGVKYLDLFQTICDEINALGYKRLTLLGTSHTVRHSSLPTRLQSIGCELVSIQENLQDSVDQAIREKLALGVDFPAAQKIIAGALHTVKSDHLDCVVLACTELPLVITDSESNPYIIDSVKLLAEAAIMHCQ